MKIHYYSGWFDEELPDKMIELILNDIIDRRSLAIVWGCWAIDEYYGIVKNVWLDPAGIKFDEYHLIDSRMSKVKAHESLKNASVILLMGGETELQNAFINEYELTMPIKESKAAVIMGFSAGAKNMASQWVCSKNNGYNVETTQIYHGLGLDNFCYEPYFTLDNDELIKKDLLPLSQMLNVYATSTGSFLRVKNSQVTTAGEVFLISGNKINKVL